MNESIDVPAEKISSNQLITDREYKDTLFRTLFSEPKRFLDMYNAISGENLASDIEITLCPPSPLIKPHNDIAFQIGSKLIIMCEHQSTINPNMPVRLFLYMAETLRKHILDDKALFGGKLVKIPTPEFYVLYNGKERLHNGFLRLSDAFETGGKAFSMEINVRVIDIRYDNLNDDLRKSVYLSGYSYFILEIEKNIDMGYTRDAAIRNAIRRCREYGILVDFLTDDYERLVNMVILEYDRERELNVIREEGREEGREENSISIARNLIAMNLSKSDISKATGLPIDSIESLAAEA